MIIRPFNAAHLLLLALAAGAVVLLWVLLRGQPERCRSAVLIALCAANIIGFFVYKGFLSRDMQFLEVSGLDRFNWFSELPMQLCNINMFLIPIGILTKRRSLLGFAFCVARSLRSWHSCFRRRRLLATLCGCRGCSAFTSRISSSSSAV